jgi:hypothetical protein
MLKGKRRGEKQLKFLTLAALIALTYEAVICDVEKYSYTVSRHQTG